MAVITAPNLATTLTLDDFPRGERRLKVGDDEADIHLRRRRMTVKGREMIDVDRLEQRLELSLTEDLRVYRAGRAPAPGPDEARRPEIAAEPHPTARPEPWPSRPEPPRERRRELRRDRRVKEEPPLDPGYVVIRPQPRPEALFDARTPAPATAFGPAAGAPRPGPVRTEAPSAGQASPHRAPRSAPAADVFARLDLDVAGHARQVAELLAEGDRLGADYHVAAHAALAAEHGRGADRRDAAALATMVALLDGREAEARSGSAAVLALGREAQDPEALAHYWAQRLWIVLEWGREEEHGELLDYCRERAYRDDDTAWMGAISLLLARGGRVDEARAAFDAASRALETAPGCVPERSAGSPAWLDLATDLAEVAALLGDAGRAATVTRALARTAVPSVTIGRGSVCKGATARYRGLLAAALGRSDEADREYRAATELQRRLEAGPLLARTLHEWGRALHGRDDLRSRSYLQEGAELGRRLALADFLARPAERAG